MKGLKKQRRIQVVSLAGVSIVGVLAILWFLPDDAFQFFRLPTGVLAEPPNEQEFFQLGGIVKIGSITPVTGVQFSFVVEDCEAELPVTYVGNDPAPDLFGEGQMTIVKGNYINGVFKAAELLAKHDEDYKPAEVVDAIEEQGGCLDPNG